MEIALVLGCGCCCFVFFFLISLIAILTAADPPDYRMPAPGGVDFGPSRFDASCSYTYRPETAVTKRQTAGNRSFVTHGLETVPNTYEYLVFELLGATEEGRGVCTGSIVDSRHVLTAAHCVANKDRTGFGSLTSDFIDKKAVVYLKMAIVKAFSDDPAIIQHSQVAGADAIYIHSDYDSLGSTDIALIRLNRTLTFNDYIKPVCLAGYKDELPGRCVVIGYGQIEGKESPKWLYRAPNIAIHSTESCSKGELAKVTADQIYERAGFGILNRLRFNNQMKWFLPIFYKARLCSLTEADGSNICSGDSGGPLMCTPGGVTSNKEYHNPKSSLFRTTDPTLKQFGTNEGSLNRRKCGEEGLVTTFMSVKDLRLWLEFIAWPALQDPTGTKRKETTRYDACILNFNWAGVLAAIKKGDQTDNLPDRYRVHICRKFNSYMNCADNSPKLEYCDHLISTILNTLSDVSLYVDLLPLFKAERCRQQKGAAGC